MSSASVEVTPPGTVTAVEITLTGPSGASVVEVDVPGIPGAPGIPGTDGVDGAPGAAGKSAFDLAVDNGFVGTEAEWLASLTGPQGAPGPQGDQGPSGPAGAVGPKGDPGDPGPAGPAGADGAPGPAGADGAPGAAGESAYQVAVDNGFAGTEAEWLASLQGPKGDPGATGAEGPPGPAGLDGAPGPKGDPGAPGPAGADGAPGADGADGESAYQIAVDNGFVGTEQDWLASLKGADGAGLPSGGTAGQVLTKASAAAGDVAWATISSGGGSVTPKTAVFKASSVAVGAGKTRLYNDTGVAWTLLSVRATVETAPTGGPVVIDVNKDGVSMFTTQANRPTIAAGATTSGKVTSMDVTTVASGDYLTIDVDTATSPASGLSVTVVFQ